MVKHGELPGFRAGRMIRSPSKAIEPTNARHQYWKIAQRVCVYWRDPETGKRARHQLEARIRSEAEADGLAVEVAAVEVSMMGHGRILHARRPDRSAT